MEILFHHGNRQDNALISPTFHLDLCIEPVRRQLGEDSSSDLQDVRHSAQCKGDILTTPPQVYGNPHNKPAGK